MVHDLTKSNIIPDEVIMNKIIIIRNLRVMIDSDMAELYGVSTKRLNEAVKRNLKRFPIDFMFQLTITEKEELVANCDHLKKLKFSPYLPFVFTEHGAVMLASVLNSERRKVSSKKYEVSSKEERQKTKGERQRDKKIASLRSQ